MSKEYAHRLMQPVINLFRQTENLFFPSCCSSCKTVLPERDILCRVCRLQIKPVVSTCIALTRTTSMTVHALSAYVDPVRTLIRAKRYSDIIAGRELAQLMWQQMNMETIAMDVLVPVPLHWKRFADRGFNQAEEMALFFAQKKGIVCEPLLRRIKNTKFQADLSRDERAANVKEVFELACSPEECELYHGKHLVLVDDLFTTGATMKEAARELLKLKPASISALVAARTV